MQEDCPCTPVAAFMAETAGKYDLIEEKLKNSAEHASIVATTRSTTIGKHTASSAAATPHRLRPPLSRRRFLPAQFVG